MAKKILSLFLALLLVFSLSGCGALGEVDWDEVGQSLQTGETTPQDTTLAVTEEGHYTTKEDVSLYLWVFGHLPDNFITKKEAQKLGWSGGALDPFAPGCCIGGDSFGNYEGLLPDGPTYAECDIDTLGAKSRGAKRIVFSSDGYIYYTDDHYESFTVVWFTEDYEMKEAEVK